MSSEEGLTRAQQASSGIRARLESLYPVLALMKPVLTWREQEVVGCVLLHLRDKEIADALNMKLPTVKTYVSRLFRSFGVRSRQELANRVSCQINWNGDYPETMRRTSQADTTVRS
jgi:DNA-binding NarL/FixJ family response regulator